MKCSRFFLLLLLIPSFIYSFDEKDCQKIGNEINAELKRNNEFIQQANNLGAHEKDKTIDLLNKAIDCCNKAIGHCNKIIEKINEKSSEERHWNYWANTKHNCEEAKKNFSTQITHLQNAIDNKRKEIALDKANTSFQESEKKAALANAKIQSCPPRRLNNVDAVVSHLNKVAYLYEAAASDIREALVALLVSTAASDESSKANLNKNIESYQDAAAKYRKEADEWPATISAQKPLLKEQARLLKEERKLLEEKGYKRSSFEVQKQMVPIVEALVESGEKGSYLEELTELKNSIALFEKEDNRSPLQENELSISQEKFRARENQRRKLFYENPLTLRPDVFLQTILQNEDQPFGIPLDGQMGKGKSFTLYTEQFYRFLVQSDKPASHILAKVYKEGECVHEEKISLTLKNTLGWERYLTTDGMIFIPETKLKTEFGLDLHITVVPDPSGRFSLIVAQKAAFSGYEFSISFDETHTLYACNLAEPPPWQLGALRKTALHIIDRPIGKSPFQIAPLAAGEGIKPSFPITDQFPILDKFVEELKQDPLLLAQYVHHEIALVYPLHQENGVFPAPKIHRNAYTTFLEKQGSPWELCQLLVYLLQKAGYTAVYATGEPFSLPKAFVEKMLLTQLPEEQKEGLFQFPWVQFFDGKRWISLFPWMKEMEVREGYDLYSLMPEEYASADRWVLRYLKNDKKILENIGSDGDDSAGVLFVSFVEKELEKKGLSLADVGIHRSQIKKQFTCWEDFPRPAIKGDPQILLGLSKTLDHCALASIEISSRGPTTPPTARLKQELFVADLICNLYEVCLSPDGKFHLSGFSLGNCIFSLPPAHDTVDIKVGYIGSQHKQTFSITKGTTAALCFHSGGSSQKLTSLSHEKFANEIGEEKRVPALLAFIGTAYFEKCCRAEQILASLHKVKPKTMFAAGLAKLSPGNASLKGTQDLKFPQVDMCWFSRWESPSDSLAWHQEARSAYSQFSTLLAVDQSSNEHRILHEIYEDPKAISTVKLLQLAHQEHEKKGLPDAGFLVFTDQRIKTAESNPEAAQDLYFSHLKELDLRQVKLASPGQWEIMKDMLDPKNKGDDWAYAYMTPGLIPSQGGFYKEMGTFIFSLDTQYGLVSNNNLLLNGGLGSPLPNSYFTAPAINHLELVSTYNSCTNYNNFRLQVTPSPSSSTLPASKEMTKWSHDVRPDSKSNSNFVGDPVDVVTGAFYVDETDLAIPGPFPLEIRRNYNSQNPLTGDFGCGWKLSLNPFLIKQDGKLYAAEQDGTVIVYRFNKEASRWTVFPEDNPDLCNFNQKGIGSTANPFHAYIENNILYGTDGSKRFFEEGLLKKWANAKGNTLTFSYTEGRLSRIESSSGDFCGFHYNSQEKISEIYARDGRRITYFYDSRGDLRRVQLPNNAIITYEYDASHQIVKETKSHGRVLENKYENGKVKEQLSPMGPQQRMAVTATFDYQDCLTTVTDANGGCTTYKIFQKQIYKITDPLGHKTLQSWYIDSKSWFDPETERVVEWNQPGGWQRSLKSSTDKRGLITYYLYDSRGNPEEMGLVGADLTGNGETRIAKKCFYNERNLCFKEETFGHKTIITYDAAFSYLPKRVEKYAGDTLLSFTELEYNSLGQVEKENNSGAITLWKYDTRGFPRLKTQITGTDDPDVITTFSYNNQGQCKQTVATDSTQENDYDIMGNRFRSEVFSPSGTLLSATYIGYNLNNEPIWKQTANPQNVLYIDYHASGRIKASRQNISPTNLIAYTLYEYDPCGYLIEEVDPLGYCTYRDYDLLGRVKRETKEKLSTVFTYEPGGLIETVSSPSGAKTTRRYTTNGLLKEEIYPDGTQSSIVYDFLGRPSQETKNDITWEVRYDDAHHRVIRVHPESKVTEIQEFDARGNLIRLTDAAGYTWIKTYDGLGRLKTETTPSGEQTLWNYQGDKVICTRPNGEKTVKRYEGGQVVESEVFDAKGQLIAHSSFRYDPETDIQEVTQGDEITTTLMNALGLPVSVQKGELTTSYEYDTCGHCIASIDGEGRTTRQKFDGLGRIIQKELPDGSMLGYDYDLDSNLCECFLPNNTSWNASYDGMGRKYFEELRAGRESSQRWEYTYENGYLTETKDPMQRIHAYLYDYHGRLTQENVEGWQRTYTYDSRGSLATAEQNREGGFSDEHSLVKRTYDPDGHLASESIYLNSNLLQETHQTWNPSGRSLEIEGHERRFVYQNNQLVQVSAPNIALSYAYDLSRSLKSKTTPVSIATIGYNTAGLPKNIYTQLPNSTHEQSLKWDHSGKLSFYSAPGQQKMFTYTSRGHLKSAGEEKYEFDFGATGTGIRTLAPHRYVPQDGLDAFGKVTREASGKDLIATTYNPMGETIFHHQRQFDWDPWGMLLKVTDGALTWEASYDALGRRLQTRYKPTSTYTLITTSLYDPEEEFQEIGVKYGNKTYWKIYGPNSCDAVYDDTGASVYLMQNALGQLVGVIRQQGILYNEQFPSAYGPQAVALIPSDLLTYAQSLSWQSKSQDPTGLIWMGARYYDPKGGRFISPDPVSYPLCLDLYTYAGGDPVNYFDPDGRCSSSVYQPIKSATIQSLNNEVLHDLCGLYVIGKGKTHSKLGFGFANGIRTTLQEGKDSARIIQKWIGGYDVDLQYNSTEGLIADLHESRRGLMGEFVEPMKPILKSWDRFFERNPEGYFLQYTTSQGVINVRNCLQLYPAERRNRILPIAVEPAAYIDPKLCLKVQHFISENDFYVKKLFTKFDCNKPLLDRDNPNVTYLKAHKEAPRFTDHGWGSPTHYEPVHDYTLQVMEAYGN